AEEDITRIPLDTLLDIYRGYDGKPIEGEAFIGREAELESLQRALCCDKPGASLVFGVRRLGKTSLMGELRRRKCATHRSGSRTMFITIPVDTFEGKAGSRFLGRFYEHIAESLVYDNKNQLVRDLYERAGVGKNKLRQLSILGEEYKDVSFKIKLNEYMSRLRQSSGNRIDKVVLIFDEFDKLLESYRKGMEADVEELLNHIRHVALEEDDVGVVLVGSDLMREVVTRYRSALHGSATEIEVSRFVGEERYREAEQIVAPHRIRQHREFPGSVVREAVEITGGHPLYLKIVGCAVAEKSDRRRISNGMLHKAVRELIDNKVLQGSIPDPRNLVQQPMQALALMRSEIDEACAKLLLVQLSRHTSLERRWASWNTVVNDDRILSLRPRPTWDMLRDGLRDASLIVFNDNYLISLTFPILAEVLRVDAEMRMDRLCSEIEMLIEGKQ
ncbi:ATP-binding protein, partial [bacterium]|nr:ATP-binding protein [bacterium]